jgi:hypothetical protein
MSVTPRNRVFVSYSHADARWLSILQTHLKPFVRQGYLEPWTDRDIRPGDNWRESISQALSEAAVAVLLVTPEFLASDFIVKDELPPLLAANRAKGLVIVWIAVKDSAYGETVISEYQAANDPKHPLESLPGHSRSRVMVKIAKSIKEAIERSNQPGLGLAATTTQSTAASDDLTELGRATDQTTRPLGIIPIYRDPTEPLDWFAEVTHNLDSVRPMLNPRLPYFGPGLASLWIRLCQSTKYVQEMNAEFSGHMNKLLRMSAGSSINVIDLGIGDFNKGRIVLEKLIRRRVRVNYVPVDVSYEMIVIALNRHGGDRSLLARLNDTGSIWAINSTFANLPKFRSVLPKTKNLFLLLGNTLGNEMDESDMLAQIARVMNPDDELLVEVQLLEDHPPTTETLTDAFQEKKFFYGAPFFALGYREDDVDVWVSEDSEPRGSLPVDAWTVTVNATLKHEHEIHHPGLPRRVRIGPKPKVGIQIIRTYRHELPVELFEHAGLAVTDSVSTNTSDAEERRFQYIIAKRS